MKIDFFFYLNWSKNNFIIIHNFLANMNIKIVIAEKILTNIYVKIT